MNTCKPQKISLLDNTNCLLPNDIIPVVQKGANRTISAKNLIDLIINRIKDILPGSSEAMCIAVEAKKLAELASADATLALKNLANALAYATKAYQLACLMDARILALEGDHALIIELQDALALLTRQVNINTQRINDIINSNILKITTDADNNYTIYTFYVDNRKIGEIKVPKPKEYTGSQYIDINEERVISLTGLANVAFTGDYTDLSNRPTKLTDFYIDIDFLKDSDLEDIEDRITDLEECCEELHRKPNKLISKLIEECDNPIVLLNGNVRSLTYDVFIDINTVNDTEYVIPDSETWNDIILPNSTHTITIVISSPYFGKDLTLYNNGRLIPMSSERIGLGITLWSAKLTDIRGNVILTGKIFSSFDSSDIAVYDIDSGKKLYTSTVDIDLTPGLELLRADGTDATVVPPKGYIFKENDLYILTLFPNTDWANIQYLGPTLASLEILEAPLFGRIYVSTLIEKEETLVVYHNVNLVLKGSGSGQILGDNSIEDDQDYTAVIIPNSGSTITNVRVTDMENNDVPVTSTLLGNNIQIEVPTVHSDICITVTFDLVSPTYYTVSLDQSISLATVSPTTILQNTGLNATVTPPTGYNITITKATVNGNLVPMNISGNLVVINGTYITGNVVLYGSLTKIPTSTTVTNKIENAHFTIGSTEYSTTATIPLNQSVVIRISPNTNYILDGDVKVTHGSLVLTANASNNYTVSIASVQNSITIIGKTNQSSYTVTASKNFVTAINTIEPNTVVAGSNNTIEISPKTNYILTGITDITEGGYSVINDSRVSYRKSGNNYIITFNNVLGNIVIDGTAQKLLTYSVSLAGDLKENGTTLSPTSVRQNNTLEAVVTNSDGVFITEVSMGGTKLLESDYTLTQNSFTNSTVTIRNVTGNVVITGVRGIRGYNNDPQLSKEFNWYEKAATYSELPRTMFLIVGNNLNNWEALRTLETSINITNAEEFIARSRGRSADSSFPYDEVWLDVAPWKLNITMNEKTTNASITYNGVTKTITGITLTANPKSGYCFVGESNAKYTAEEMSLRKIINLPLNSRPGAPSSERLAYNFIYHLSQENVRSNDGAYAGYGAPPESMTITVLELTITIPTDNLPTFLEVNNTSYEIPGISWGKVYYNYCLSYTGDGFALNCDGTENKNSHRGSTGIDIRFFFLVNEGATGTFTATFTPPLYPDEDAISSPRAKTINMSVR